MEKISPGRPRQRLPFAEGQTTATFPVPITNDASAESK